MTFESPYFPFTDRFPQTTQFNNTSQWKYNRFKSSVPDILARYYTIGYRKNDGVLEAIFQYADEVLTYFHDRFHS